MENPNKIGSINIQNNDLGYAIINKESLEINTSKIKALISQSDYVKSFLNTPFHSIVCLFSIIPEIKKFILPKILPILNQKGANYRCINSIYYDKPPGSKWDLGFHQDIMINLKHKLDDNDFDTWVQKKDFYRVKPPLEVLENIITIRIHLDNCTLENGALRLIPKSHKLGFIDVANYKIENTVDIETNEGDVLIMNPLLLHASGNNCTQEKRRIIHLEFSNIDLPWHEAYT